MKTESGNSIFVKLFRVAAVLIIATQALSTAETMDKNATIYQTLEWSIENVSYSGNPFDVDAGVTFTHGTSARTHETRMFYDENNTWKFRFTGTRAGAWTFSSSSGNSHLAGKSGTVTVSDDPAARGFLTVQGAEFAIPVGSDDNLAPFLFHVYMDEYNYRTNGIYGDELKDWLPDVEARTRKYCVAAKTNGMSVIFINPHVQLFKLGVVDSRNLPSGTDGPDPATFRILERIIKTAREESCHLHIWKWGDEERYWTPIRVGGINGTQDKRVQRYVAARLGPLPGWSMGYGFDLQEWVSPKQVTDWSDYLNRQWGWKHLLMARQESTFKTPSSMDVFSTDHRFSSNWYANAVSNLDGSGNRPVLFSRRWIYTRDNYGMDETRRAMWQFTLASGAGAAGWFGPNWGAGATYPNPEQLVTYARFQDDRLQLGMVRDNGRNKTGGTSYCLRDAGLGRFVFYSENTSAMTIDLSGVSAPLPVVAVNTKKGYAEVVKGSLGAGTHPISLGEQSDWAIAVGDFAHTTPVGNHGRPTAAHRTVKEATVRVSVSASGVHAFSPSGPAQFRLYAVDGRLVEKSQSPHVTGRYFGNLSAGAYVLYVNTDAVVHAQRVVVGR